MQGSSYNRLNDLQAEDSDPQDTGSVLESTNGQKCKIHTTEDIKAFCKDDLCSICFKCLLGEHRKHDVIMLDELQVSDLSGKVSQFQEKVENQITKLAGMREKVGSIKENYDKKFESLFAQFRDIESLFINGYFEQETLGDLKNGKHRQESILMKVSKSVE